MSSDAGEICRLTKSTLDTHRPTCLVSLGMLRERMKGNLDLLLLAVLAAAPTYGYELAQRLRQHSDGAFDLPEGTIYPALYRLEKRGWVSSSWELVEGRRRRIYALTSSGRHELTAQRREWATFTTGMAAVLGGEPA